MQEQVRKQYKDASNLNARIQIHVLFSTNPVPWQQWIFNQFQLRTRAAILELGCGPGDLWVQNRSRVPRGWEITLSDFSPGMVEAARRNLRGMAVKHPISFEIADAQDLPYDDTSFDAVIANHMLYHVPDRPQALAEIQRVLKTGGHVYASTVGVNHMGEMWALLQPFAPHLVPERFSQVSSTFTLENGASQLAQVFGDVERRDYEDSLEITDAEPVIAYLRSSQTLAEFQWTDAVAAHVRDQVNAAIAARGAFHVTKASGLFIAVAD